MRRANVCGVAVLAALAGLVAGGVVAGPLDPPNGPVAPTYKTLTEVEPRIAVNSTNTRGDNDATPSLFKIAQPGSYYLTGNVTGVIGKIGIEIAASGVTLDLMGFEVVGVAGSLDGVGVTAATPTNISVVNGGVRGWGEDGVDATLTGQNMRLADLRVSGNTARGIVAGLNASISGCVAQGNGAEGFQCANGSVIEGCTAFQNNIGFYLLRGCSVANCAAHENVQFGFVADMGTALSFCTAFDNGSIGIGLLQGGMITGCAARNNAGEGITANSGSSILDCTSSGNAGNGIRVQSDCIVRSNTCHNNGLALADAAGILVAGNRNRIEGNSCLENDRGIEVEGSVNVIIRNTCARNTTNWSIDVGNAVGPIVQAQLNAAPISGDAYAGSLSNTDPNANFTH